jgi:hypothetical protein
VSGLILFESFVDEISLVYVADELEKKIKT